MKDWNVVVTVYEEGYRPAQRILRQLGQISPSSYHNLLLMRVDDPVALLETLEERAGAEPSLAEVISRVAPAMASFDFRNL